MSFLLFKIGFKSYVVNCIEVIRIIPAVPLQTLSHPKNYLVGLLFWEHDQIPVVDLGLLIENKPTPPAYHSRIILLTDHKTKKVIGFLAEKVTDILDISLKDTQKLVDSHLDLQPYLEVALNEDNTLIYLLNTPKLFEFLADIPVSFSASINLTH